MLKRFKLFSHRDLDGYGCNILAKTMLNCSKLDCENLDYDTINERVKEFFDNGEWREYDIVYITDISVNEEVAEIIEYYTKTHKGFKVVLLDHHPTALWLNKYDWATVKIEANGEKTCGTELFSEEIFARKVCIVDKHSELAKDIYKFVYYVRLYDTWSWKEKYNDIQAKELNDLFYILGFNRFYDAILDNLVDNNGEIKSLLNKYRLLLELQQEEIDRYIKAKNKQIIAKEINGYNVGIVFAERFASELGNKLSELNPCFDLVTMISGNGVSFRTTKKNVNCGEFANLFGGGGHPKSAGCQISDKCKEEYINLLFKDDKMFKIGDRVIFTGIVTSDLCNISVGSVGVITDIDTSKYPIDVNFESGYFCSFKEEELELVTEI